jgi:hypothetical protein
MQAHQYSAHKNLFKENSAPTKSVTAQKNFILTNESDTTCPKLLLTCIPPKPTGNTSLPLPALVAPGEPHVRHAAKNQFHS